ncbi:unnamed protein product, partial [Prorocentrum cordatum]
IRASAEQTKELSRCCSGNGFIDIGESFVVARQFCSRYGEVLQLGSDTAPASISVTVEGRNVVDITFMNRKCYSEPDVVARRCICDLQGKALCGVCRLVARYKLRAKLASGAAASASTDTAPQAEAGNNVIFPGMTYAMSLAVLKLAAQGCGFADA